MYVKTLMKAIDRGPIEFDVEPSMYVKTLMKAIDRGPIEFDVEPSMYVKTLMKAIEEIEGTPRHLQRIIFAGRELDPYSRLSDQLISKESTIHMFQATRYA